MRTSYLMILLILGVSLCSISCTGISRRNTTQPDLPEEPPPKVTTVPETKMPPADSSAIENAPTHEHESTQPEKPVDRFGSAAQMLEEGKIDQAVEELGKAVQESPGDTETQLALATLLLSDGRIDEAETTLQEITEKEPENADAFFLLSSVSYLRGDAIQREKYIRHVLDLNPDHADALAALGEILAVKGKQKEAEKKYARSLEIDPVNITALMGIGNLLTKEGRYEAAVEHFDTAVDVEPENPAAYIDRSRAKRALEDNAGAEADLTHAINLIPDYYWNYIDRGKLRLFQNGDLEGAMEDFTQAISIDPDLFYAYIYRAGIHDDLKHYAEALEDYEKAIADRPDYNFAYAPMGRLAYIMNDGDAARKYFSKALEYEPGETTLTFMIYLCYLREGDRAGAKQYIQQKLQGIPRDSIYYHIGRSFLEPAYLSIASRELNEQKDPILKARLLYYLGEYQLAHGSDMIAVDFFLQVLNQEMPAILEYRLAEWRLEEMGIQ